MSFSEIMSDSPVIVSRAFCSVVVLFILSKLMGKKQITQMSFFDYIVGITIGSIAAEMSFDDNLKLFKPIIAMSVYAVCDIAINISTNKSIKLRRLFVGKPVVIINKGKIVEKNMSKEKFDMNDLLSTLRIAGYFDVSDIEYAILETSGQLSILPKSDIKPATPKDMGISVKQDNVIANVIIDGNIMYRNLKACGKSEEWLLKELKKQKQDNISDIILATVDDNKLSVFTKMYEKVDIEILN